MALGLYALYTFIHGLLAWFLWQHRNKYQSLSAVFSLIVLLGLIYDNAVLVAGTWVQFGSLLENLSYGRFLFHVFLTPLLCLVAGDIARRGGLAKAQHPRFFQTMVGITVILIILGLILERSLALQPVLEAGVYRYKATATMPPLPAIVATLILIAVGIQLWKLHRWMWLALASTAMLVGSAATFNLPVVGSGFEVILMAGIVATEWWLPNALQADRSATPQPIEAHDL